MDRKEAIGNRLAPQIDKRTIDKGRPRKRRLASSRAVQDERPCGNSEESLHAWHDALAFRGRSPSVTKSAMHRLLLVVLNHAGSAAA